MQDWGATVAEYVSDLQGANRSPGTIVNYKRSLDLFAASVDALPDPPDVVADVTKQMVTAFISARLEMEKDSTVLTRFRTLRAFWNWCAAEEIIERSPMAHVKEPFAPLEPPKVLTDDQLTALFDTCRRDRTFIGRRDFALMVFMVDTGCRVGEVAGLILEDLHPDEKIASVLGKGRRRRVVAFGPKTAKALFAYLRERSKHNLASDPHVFLGQRGPLQPPAMWDIVKARGEQAGLPGLFPHLMRHTFAHRFRSKGGNPDDLGVLGGWRSQQMLARYGASAAAERAVEAHRKIDPLGDV